MGMNILSIFLAAIDLKLGMIWKTKESIPRTTINHKESDIFHIWTFWRLISPDRCPCGSASSSCSPSFLEVNWPPLHLSWYMFVFYVGLMLSHIWIILGTFIFKKTQGWSIMDSKHVLCYCSQYQKLISNIEENSTILQLSGIYFCFITLSTIGFGDFVPVRYSIALLVIDVTFSTNFKIAIKEQGGQASDGRSSRRIQRAGEWTRECWLWWWCTWGWPWS